MRASASLRSLIAFRRRFDRRLHDHRRQDSLEAIVQTVCETEPRAPSESVGDPTAASHSPVTSVLASELRGDLDTIVLKALRKEPERRYLSALELSEDLRRHLGAERRFADVRDLATSFLFDIHDEIRELPGSTQVRQHLVETAQEYLDDLAREAAGDTELQRDLTAAYERLGDVQEAR